MKTIYFITLIFIALGCKAQNIVPLYDSPEELPENAYLKDIDNDLTDYVGTWLWEDGFNSISLQFQKIEMTNSILYLDDSLIGEYKYVSNGVEILNSLPINYTGDPISHHIYGGVITTIGPGLPSCSSCGINPRYVLVQIEDVLTTGIRGNMTMVHYIDNGVEKFNVRISNTLNENLEVGYTGPLYLSIPEGDYTFIKQ